MQMKFVHGLLEKASWKNFDLHSLHTFHCLITVIEFYIYIFFFPNEYLFL